jgi:hypothetical protein
MLPAHRSKYFQLLDALGCSFVFLFAANSSDMSSDACLDCEFPSLAPSDIHSIDQADFPPSFFDLNVDLTCYEDFNDEDNDVKINGREDSSNQFRLVSAASDNIDEKLGDWLSNVGEILLDSVDSNYLDSTQSNGNNVQQPVTCEPSTCVLDLLRLYSAVYHKIYNDSNRSAVECNFEAGRNEESSSQEVPDLFCRQPRCAPVSARLLSDCGDKVKRCGVQTALHETVSTRSNFTDSAAFDSASDVASYHEEAFCLPMAAGCRTDLGQNRSLEAAETSSDAFNQFDSNSETSSSDSESSDRRVPVSCTANIEHSDQLHFIEE